MEIVEFYLLLQNSRYEDKITYEIIYGNEEVKKDLIPRLLIEPLVENAVSHGLEPKEEKGKITVEIYEKEEKLHIVVKDDGVGFDQEELKNSQDMEKTSIEHTGTGLENTERLLKILYGEQYEMKICGEKGKGTTVQIILPIEKQSGDMSR